MKKTLYILLLLLIPATVMSQQDNAKNESKNQNERPAMSIYTDIFSIRHLTFNKKVDRTGRGELLQVEFQLYNNTDFPRDLYLFVLGSYEELKWKMNSFGDKKIYPEDNIISYLAAYPNNTDNFKYEENGNERYYKVPKDYKIGINPINEKPYNLNHSLIVRTELLNKYRKNYKFFNHVTLIIYDDEGKLIFRQVYTIDSIRK